jgi:hypothetical protein
MQPIINEIPKPISIPISIFIYFSYSSVNSDKIKSINNPQVSNIKNHPNELNINIPIQIDMDHCEFLYFEPQ